VIEEVEEVEAEVSEGELPRPRSNYQPLVEEPDEAGALPASAQLLHLRRTLVRPWCSLWEALTCALLKP